MRVSGLGDPVFVSDPPLADPPLLLLRGLQTESDRRAAHLEEEKVFGAVMFDVKLWGFSKCACSEQVCCLIIYTKMSF